MSGASSSATANVGDAVHAPAALAHATPHDGPCIDVITESSGRAICRTCGRMWWRSDEERKRALACMRSA